MRHSSAEEATSLMRERFEAGEDALFVDMSGGRIVAYDSESESVLRVDHDPDYILGSVLRGEDLADVASWGSETPIRDELALDGGGLGGGCCYDLDTGTDAWLVDPEPLDVEREFAHGHLARLTDLVGDEERWRRAALTALDGVPGEEVVVAVDPGRLEAQSGGWMDEHDAMVAATQVAKSLRDLREAGGLRDLDDALGAEVEARIASPARAMPYLGNGRGR